MISGQDGKTGFRRGVASNRRGRGCFALFSMPLMLAATVAPTPACAEQYWVVYEGNDLPEKVGWTRFVSGPGVERRIEGGNLVVDSRLDPGLTDIYSVQRKGAMDPGPGETFVANWRLRVEDVTNAGAAVVIRSDQLRVAGFLFAESFVVSAYNLGLSFPFEPLEFHDFEFRSADMQTYELYVDGIPAFQDDFSRASTASSLAFGDLIDGGSAIIRWDHVRFGVVPDPNCCWILFGAPLLRRNRHSFC